MNGLYDGFEGYRLSTPDEVAQALLNGVVVIDANVLLNLYEYNANTGDDLLAVLERLGDRLVIPHQALREFWRNRIKLIGNPNAASRAATSALDKSKQSASNAVDQWAKQVALEDSQRDALHEEIEGLYDRLVEAVTGGQPDRVDADPTAADPVLGRLETLLDGKVMPPLDAEQWKLCVEEGKRRADASEPPGYRDVHKDGSALPEGPAGDYLVWHQACQASKERDRDLVIVTGDEKEDWWWKHRSAFLGPRPELVAELLAKAGRRLFMLRPRDLLAASAVLQVTVREESLADAERARQDQNVRPEWTPVGVSELLERLDAEGAVQAEVIRAAAQSGGEIDRTTIYEIGGYEDDRMLRGFTRPVLRVTSDLQAEGLVADGVTPMLVALYPVSVRASAFRVPAEVVRIVQGGELPIPVDGYTGR